MSLACVNSVGIPVSSGRGGRQLRCFNSRDGEDVYWITVQHHMGKPHERVASQVYKDDPRQAIREAIARLQRDPYCTGPLHEDDQAARQLPESTT